MVVRAGGRQCWGQDPGPGQISSHSPACCPPAVWPAGSETPTPARGSSCWRPERPERPGWLGGRKWSARYFQVCWSHQTSRCNTFQSYFQLSIFQSMRQSVLVQAWGWSQQIKDSHHHNHHKPYSSYQPTITKH